MPTAIKNKKTGAVLRVYDGAPKEHHRWINFFDYKLADLELVDHIEIPDCPGEEGDCDLDANSVPPKWVPNIPAIRARLLREFEAEGFSRVAAVLRCHRLYL